LPWICIATARRPLERTHGAIINAVTVPRLRWWLAAIWLGFLFRGWFYAAMFPLWEGFDEFAHFGVIRAMAVKGVWLPPRNQPEPRDVVESLQLAPVPWQVRGWHEFRSSLTEEQYWALPAGERHQRESALRNLPASWSREDSAGPSAYEALQPPLYYWLMAPVLYVLKDSGLLAQVLWLRMLSAAIASLAVPLTFAIAFAVTGREPVALGCAAVLAVMPGFAIDVGRVSNESLSILLFTVLTWVGLRVLTRAPDMRGAVALGVCLGLGLLTKAYFLTAVPAVFLLLIYKYRRAWTAGVASGAVTLVIAGWWYARNILTTGTLAGLAESVILRNKSLPAILSVIPHVPWLRALDTILVSHLYYGGWSSLGVRSWMYHVFFTIVLVAALGLVAQLRRVEVLWLAAVYGFFWLGQFYNVLLQYLANGLAGSMGWYMYAVVACEVVLCAVAFRCRVWTMTLGTILFALLDLYGMHWVAIPYYTGMIVHKFNGALTALHLVEVRDFDAVFARLAANKPPPLSAPVLIVLWILYLAGTVLPIVLVVCDAMGGYLRRECSESRNSSNPGNQNATIRMDTR